jgi:hypothetical protein
MNLFYPISLVYAFHKIVLKVLLTSGRSEAETVIHQLDPRKALAVLTNSNIPDANQICASVC